MLKKDGVINAPLNGALSQLGHCDLLVVCDAGFPIPKQVVCIDLALVPGDPGLIKILTAIIGEIDVERAIVADEIKEVNRKMRDRIEDLLRETEKLKLESVPHQKFKEISKEAKYVVRTGEVTPYSNVILVSGAKSHIITG